MVFCLSLLQGCGQTGIDPAESPTESPEQLQVTDAADAHAFYDFYGNDRSRTKTSDTQNSTDSKRYSCYMSRYVSGEGYYVKSLYLSFPASITEGMAKESIGIVRWTHKNEAVDHPSGIEAMLICRIPQIQEAAAIVLDHFDLQRNSSVPKKHTAPKGISANSVTTMPNKMASEDEHVFMPVLDGRISNDEGFTCMEGTDWLSYDQQYCTDGNSLYYPEVPVEAPGPGSGGGSGGSEDDDNDFPYGGEGPLPNPAPREGEGGEPVPEDEEPLTILIKESFASNPCLSSVYVQAGKTPAYQDILQNFDGEFSVANLILSAGVESGHENSNAVTFPPSNHNIEIMFNPNNLERPSLDVARTLIHELIHAEMYRKLLSIAEKPHLRYSEYTEQEWRSFVHGLRNNFEGLYDYYYRFRWGLEEGEEPGSAQHQAMAQHYRTQIEQAMRGFNGSFPDDIYEALAWSGLMGDGDINFSTGLAEDPTVAWEEKTKQERLNIINKILDFRDNNPNCQ